jgi:hypothetical protein
MIGNEGSSNNSKTGVTAQDGLTRRPDEPSDQSVHNPEVFVKTEDFARMQKDSFPTRERAQRNRDSTAFRAVPDA